MKPYYEDASVTLYHGDCREVLPTLSRGSADLLLTDPPYGVSWQSGHRHRAFERLVGDDGTLDVAAALAAALRVLKSQRHSYIFGRHDLSALPFGGTCELIWDKVGLTGGDTNSGWATAHDYIQFGMHSAPSQRHRGDGNGAARLRRGSVLRYPRTNGNAVTRHPTEKPVALLRELIEMSSRPGELVLDPFAGVGSTGVAAVMEGRRAVLIELEERYCEVAADRLRKMQPALALFQEAAG